MSIAPTKREQLTASIEDAITSIYVDPGNIFEVVGFSRRAGNTKPEVIGYYSHGNAAKAARDIYQLDADATRFSGFYLLLNPVHDDMLAKCANRIERRDSRASKTSIKRRRRFVIDIDPERLSGISATEDEREAARAVAVDVDNFLCEQGWPQAAFISSGNGYQYIYAYDEPNDDATADLIKSLLAGLHAKFSVEGKAHVDTSCFDACRLVCFPWTMKRKGDHVPEMGREHRLTEVISKPDVMQLVTREQIEAVIALLPQPVEAPKADKPTEHKAPAIVSQWRVDDYPIAERIERLRACTKNSERCLGGTGGDGEKKFLSLCCTAVRFGLDEHNYDVFEELNQKFCDPVFDDKGLRHKIQDAMKLVGAEFGTMLLDRAPRSERKSIPASAVEQPPKTRPKRDNDKISANNLDPSLEAIAFRNAYSFDGVSRLQFWRGEFYEWKDGAYRAVKSDEIQAKIINRLDEFYYKLTTAAFSTTLAQLKAKCTIFDMEDCPCWLTGQAVDGPARDWDLRDVVNCKNGLIHLPSFVEGYENYLHPPTPRYFTLNALDFDFQPNPRAPRNWFAFLESVFPNDPDSIALLQEWFGYCLTHDTSLQKILLIIGPTRSGKGTIFRVLSSLLGKGNVVSPSMADFSEHFMEHLISASVAMIADARIGARSDISAVVAKLLAISGEDLQDVHRKHLPAIRSVHIRARIMIASNELPRLGDSSQALANRMLPLRMTESFLDREDHELEERILTERQGILMWAIDGWHRLRTQKKFTKPKTSEVLRKQFTALSSPVTEFAGDCLVIDPTQDIEEATTNLYEAWKKWCESSGQHATAKNVFGRDFAAAFPQLRHGQNRDGAARIRVYRGVKIRPEVAWGTE